MSVSDGPGRPYQPQLELAYGRAADDERDAVAEIVRSAAAEGKLRHGELEERLDSVYAAKTHGELAGLISDLVPPPAPAAPPVPATPSPSNQTVPWTQPGVSDKTIVPAAILCVLFGVFGAHRFYAGRTKSAVVMLVLFFATAGVVPAVWMLADLIVLLTRSFRDGNGDTMRNWT